MRTIDLEIAAMGHFGVRQNLIVPNVSNMMGVVGFEADLLMISKSGYAHCIEIKVSKNDLKNDLKKKHINNLGEMVWNGKSALDHYYGKLKHFSYLVPEKIEETAINQIPEFAGLFIAYKPYTAHSQKNIICIKEIRKPKKIFNYKWTLKEKYEVARLGTLRILSLKKKINI